MENFFKILVLFVCSCGAFESSASNSSFQYWVIDPRNSLFPSLPIVAPNAEGEICRAHSQLFLNELKNKTLWAMQMWDSSAKTPDGVLTGGVFQYGNFDECVNIAAPFKTQYCLGHLFANVSLLYYNFRDLKTSPGSSVWTHVAKSRVNPSKVSRDLLGWGLCVPASCKTSEIQEAINSHLEAFSNEFYNETTFKIRINRDFCAQKKDFIYFSPAEIAFWVFVFALVLMTTSSSIMDLLVDRKDAKPSKAYNLWMLFSVKQNYSHLIPMGTRTSSYLDVFHGIKFVSILFIIYGHRVGISLSLSALNYDEVEEHFFKDHKMFFVHTDLVVDTFIFISGLLACYIMMDVLSKRFVNPLYAIAVRIFRLSPIYFLVLWFQSGPAFRLASGPFWNSIAKNETKFCVDHWWTNVLFISNYVHVDEMCMPHSWFLPCELHFFIVATILVPIIVKYKRIGQAILGAAIAVFSVLPGVLIYMYSIPPLILFYLDFLIQPRQNASFSGLYVKSHTRAAVYFIGMAVGLYLHYTRDSKKRISMVWTNQKLTLCGVLGWFAFMFAPMAYGSLYYDVEKPFNLLESAIFGALRRVSWAIGFTIFILAHRFGTIPLVDLLFSTKLALFLSRITYGMYLVHFTMVTADIVKNRTPTVFNVHDVVIAGIGDILKSAFVTVILSFILEIPLKRFFKEVLFAKKVNELEQPPATVQNVFTVRL